jgi:hypothetical protein
MGGDLEVDDGGLESLDRLGPLVGMGDTGLAPEQYYRPADNFRSPFH